MSGIPAKATLNDLDEISGSSKGTLAAANMIGSEWNPSPIVIVPDRLQNNYNSEENQIESQLARKRTLTRKSSVTRSKSLSRPERSQHSTNRRDLFSDDPLERLTVWKIYYTGITCCCPGFLLAKFGGLHHTDMQRAWREKVALCSIILVMMAGLAFITFGLRAAICTPENFTFTKDAVSAFGPQNNPSHVTINGAVYNMQSILQSHGELPTFVRDAAKKKLVEDAAGVSVSSFFNRQLSSTCQSLLQIPLTMTCASSDFPGIEHCHDPSVVDPLLESIFVGPIYYSWEDVSAGQNLMVFSGFVIDMSFYLSTNSKFFGEEFDRTVRSQLGRDASIALAQLKNGNEYGHCMLDLFNVGRLEQTSTGCWTSQVVLLVSFVVIICLIGARFILALVFSWVISSRLGKLEKDALDRRTAVRKTTILEGKFPITLQDNFGNVKNRYDPTTALSPIKSATLRRTVVKSKSTYGDEVHTIMLVTCYSEDEHALKMTFDSLAETKYNEDYKMLFIVADGLITGSGNKKSTPDMIIDLLELDENWINPPPLAYEAVADGSKQLNMAKVYCGWYNKGETSVPTILVVKCGTPNEVQKPGNRGKRDSQIILMRFLERVTFNQRLCPLEYDLFQKIHYLMGVTADNFEIVLMVDADTKVASDSLARMVAAMTSDSSVMGLCGETRIGNKNDSWVSRIQVFEYFLSHHMNKAFESIFGGVTCLPGCFCMYRIKAQKGDSWVPILCSPEITSVYSQSVVKTLHQKNLLLLGEDRFLTTMMLRTFPDRKLIFVPRAFCKTTVPNSFKVLLSQRRRWINSTLHNLMELVLVRELCGVFCFSMQFVIFLELIGMVTLPAAIVFTFLLILSSFIGTPQVVPLILLAAILGLPAVLILMTTRRVVYIYWMFVYLLALPVWNFVLPVYAFWHFDDFSWGQTRKVAGDKGGHDSGDSDTIGPDAIPLKRWSEWERDRRANIVISYRRRNITANQQKNK